MSKPAPPPPKSPERLSAHAPHIGPFRVADVLGAAAGVTWGICWSYPPLAAAIPVWMVLLFLASAPLTTGRDAARLGAISGIAQYVIGAHFQLALAAYSVLGVLIYLLTLLYIVPFSAGGLWLAFWFERRTGLRREWGFALVFPIMEWLRTQSPLSLPADLTAHAFGGRSAWLAWSPWIGPFGVALWSAVVACLAWFAIRARQRPPVAATLFAGALLLWIAPVATGHWLANDAAALAATRPFKVAIVQPSFSLSQKLDKRHAGDVWAKLEEMTVAGGRGADLVVWPETIRPGTVFWDEGEPFHDPEVEKIARTAGVPILYGCEIAQVAPGGQRVSALFNGAALARPDGTAGEWYGKQRLVPFLEGVPFADWFGYDPAAKAGAKRNWLTMLGNFSAGPEKPAVFSVGRARIGVLICYEGLYPWLARQYGRQGVNLVAVLVNDAWWGRTFFPAWHARVAVARAIETGCPVVRAGNNGVSCAISKSGENIAGSELFSVETLAATVDLSDGTATPYARYGDWILVLEAATLALLFARSMARQWLPAPRTAMPAVAGHRRT